MRHSRCLPAILVYAATAFAQSQPPPKSSSIENRSNIDINKPDSGTKPKEKLNKVDSQFVREALDSARAENDKARYALTRGSDPAVKDFAKRLMDDLSAERKALFATATKGGFSELMSVTGDYMTARSKIDTRTGEKRNPEKNDVSLLSGKAFDKEFLKQTIADTQARISKFEAEEKTTTNAALRDFANLTLPKLREQLAQAQTLSK